MKKIINPSIHNWVNNNAELLRNYRGQWVAHNAETVLAAADSGETLMRIIKEKGITNYVLLYVQPSWFIRPVRFPSIRKILPIHFKTFKKHEWIPNKEIIIATSTTSKVVEVLVDSGADMSLIPHWLGLELGLATTNHEVISQAHGISGSVKYVIRNLDYNIDGHLIKNVPTAWVLDVDCEDIILGREVIFDAFDIEFRQADEAVNFKHRYSHEIAFGS